MNIDDIDDGLTSVDNGIRLQQGLRGNYVYGYAGNAGIAVSSLLFRVQNKDIHRKLIAQKSKTYNTGDSLVVTDPTTNPAVTCLSMGERTGSRVFKCLWSYVEDRRPNCLDEPVGRAGLELEGGCVMKPANLNV